MKGISYWVWIAGGVIAGLIIFTIAYQQIVEINRATIEQRSLEQFSEVKHIVDNLCWSFAGNKREYTVSIGDMVEAIYVTIDKYKEYEKKDLVGEILSGKPVLGNFLCIKITDKRVNCEELECNATMPFIGSVPEEFSLSALINKLTGRGKIFDYSLEFERKENIVEIRLKS